jgi:hypothetical protein
MAFPVSFRAPPDRRLVAVVRIQAQGGVMKHTCRQIRQRVQAPRERAIIRYL